MDVGAMIVVLKSNNEGWTSMYSSSAIARKFTYTIMTGLLCAFYAGPGPQKSILPFFASCCANADFAGRCNPSGRAKITMARVRRDLLTRLTSVVFVLTSFFKSRSRQHQEQAIMDSDAEEEARARQVEALAKELYQLKSLNSKGLKESVLPPPEIQAHGPTEPQEQVNSTRRPLANVIRIEDSRPGLLKRTFEQINPARFSFSLMGKGMTRDDSLEVAMLNIAAVAGCLREGALDERVAARSCPDEINLRDFVSSIKVSCIVRVAGRHLTREIRAREGVHRKYSCESMTDYLSRPFGVQTSVLIDGTPVKCKNYAPQVNLTCNSISNEIRDICIASMRSLADE
jgi:hypothetical protein